MRRKSSKTAEAKKHRALPARSGYRPKAAYSTPPRMGPSRPDRACTCTTTPLAAIRASSAAREGMLAWTEG